MDERGRFVLSCRRNRLNRPPPGRLPARPGWAVAFHAFVVGPIRGKGATRAIRIDAMNERESARKLCQEGTDVGWPRKADALRAGDEEGRNVAFGSHDIGCKKPGSGDCR